MRNLKLTLIFVLALTLQFIKPTFATLEKFEIYIANKPNKPDEGVKFLLELGAYDEMSSWVIPDDEIEGKFSLYNGTIFYDRNEIRIPFLVFDLDVTSIAKHTWIDPYNHSNRIDYEGIPDFFNSNFPKISFESTRILYKSNFLEYLYDFEVTGWLTINGICKETTFNLSLENPPDWNSNDEREITLEADIRIDPWDFEIESWIYSKFAINIDVSAKKAN